MHVLIKGYEIQLEFFVYISCQKCKNRHEKDGKNINYVLIFEDLYYIAKCMIYILL